MGCQPWELGVPLPPHSAPCHHAGSPHPLLCGFPIFGNRSGQHFPHSVINSEALIHTYFHALTHRLERVIVENLHLDAVELRRHRGRPPSPEVLGPGVGKRLTAELREFPELCYKRLALPSCRTFAVTLEEGMEVVGVLGWGRCLHRGRVCVLCASAIRSLAPALKGFCPVSHTGNEQVSHTSKSRGVLNTSHLLLMTKARC